jgi:hypothetical protein
MKIFHRYLLCLFIFFSNNSYSQIEPYIKNFLKNKVYIVEADSKYGKSFDSSFKAAMDEYWKLSEIGGYITRKELKSLDNSPSNSFIQPATDYWTDRTNMNSGRSASGVFLYVGKKKEPFSEKFMSTWFGGWAGDNFDDAAYRAELMVRDLINQLTYYNSKDSLFKKYNPSLLKKKKILLINKRHIKNEKKRDDNITDDAFDDYPYKIKFASSEEIKEIIKNKDKRYVFAIPIVNDRTRLVHMYDVETAFFIGGFQRGGAIALPIRKKDVEKLVEIIDGDY